MRRHHQARRFSARALDKLPERARVVDAAWERDRGQCRARTLVPQVICHPTLEAHEIIPRSAWRDGELCLDNVIIICRDHHRWVDHHPDEAHALGLHGYSWERNP